MAEALGLYISVPFCMAKCSFCNFASGVFGAERLTGYVGRVVEELRAARGMAQSLGAELPQVIDTIYFGGGTPSLLTAGQVETIFGALRSEFRFAEAMEITVECAPGQLADASLQAMLAAGVNRLSFGVQSFVDAEAAAVGRLHTKAQTLAEFRRVREAGIGNISLDLIAGLPLQTHATFEESLAVAGEAGVEHISLYMLEIDEDSRLGREALANGMRYKAAALPDEETVTEWYQAACASLGAQGYGQYEISNFAREGFGSQHNVKYWRRQPYLGLGLDAHSMLRSESSATQVVRFANPDTMEQYLTGEFADGRTVDIVGTDEAFEESLFLGLRMAEGVRFNELVEGFGASRVAGVDRAVKELEAGGLLRFTGDGIALTAAGRVVSNEVFGRLLEQAG